MKSIRNKRKALEREERSGEGSGEMEDSGRKGKGGEREVQEEEKRQRATEGRER